MAERRDRVSDDLADGAPGRTVSARFGDAAGGAVEAEGEDGEALARRLRGARRTLRARERRWRAGRTTAAAAVRYAHGAVGTTLALLVGWSPPPARTGVWLSEALLELSVARPELAVSLAWRHEVDLAWMDEVVFRLRRDASAAPAEADRALAIATAWLSDAEAQAAAGRA
jgi:hypothetical protein